MTGAAPARAAPADATAPEVWWWGEGEKGGESGHCGGGDGIGAGGGATAGSCTVAGLEAAPRRFIAATTMTSTAAGGAEVLGCRRGRGAAAWCLAPVVSGYGTSADLGYHRFVSCFEALCYGGARGRQPWRPSLEGSLERPRGSKTLDGLSSRGRPEPTASTSE